MRSRLSSLFIVLLLGLLLAACVATPAATPALPAAAKPPTAIPTAFEPALPAPTVAPTLAPPTTAPAAEPQKAVPTALPPASMPDDDLSRAEVTGMLRVATALDNAPFSMRGDQGEPDGLDMALIGELARRLGFRVDIRDMEFENVMNALATNQADVAIAAISITPERANEVAFTNAYYVGQDGELAAPDSSITEVRTIDDLARLRVGVQEGTLYQKWLQENAVDTGKMPQDNLVAYDVPDQGVLDLTAGNIDVYMLDRQPARSFEAQGRAKLVGEKIYPQVYGIAVRKGSNLLPELNRVLDEVKADGTMAELVQEYLDVPAAEVLPATRPPFATDTPTP